MMMMMMVVVMVAIVMMVVREAKEPVDYPVMMVVMVVFSQLHLGRFGRRHATFVVGDEQGGGVGDRLEQFAERLRVHDPIDIDRGWSSLRCAERP
jgi:hypothetical protein